MANPVIGQMWPKQNIVLPTNPYGTILGLNPSMYVPLDDKYGTGDMSNNNRHGLIQGTGASIGGSSTTPFTGGFKTTDLDGTDDRVGSLYAAFGSGSIRTFTGWFYRDNTTNTHTMFAGDGSTTMPTVVALSGGTDIRWRTQNNSASATGQVTWAGAMPTTTWTHLAFLIDLTNDTVELVKNGISVSASSGMTQDYSSPGNFKIGASTNASNPWDGKVGHVAVFESKLTVANCLAITNAA